MNTTKFEYMLALECQGSITKAAEQFFISPSAMSQCLKTEEKQLNCHLFERKNGKMIPTQEGKIYLKSARKIVEIRERTLRELHISTQNSRNIRIMVSPMLFSEVSEKIQPVLESLSPDSGIELIQSDEKMASAYLVNDLADFALLSAPRQNHSLLTEEILGKDQLFFIVPKAYLRHQILSKPQLEDCRTVPFILTKSGSSSRTIENKILARHHVSQMRIYETEDYLMAKQFLKDGKGGAFLPASLIPENADKHFFIITPKPAEYIPFLFIWPRYKTTDRIFQKAIDIIRSTWTTTVFFKSL